MRRDAERPIDRLNPEKNEIDLGGAALIYYIQIVSNETIKTIKPIKHMKTYNETLQAAANLGYTHIELDGQLRDIDDIIAIGGADGDTGRWVLDADSIERLNADGTRTCESYRLISA